MVEQARARNTAAVQSGLVELRLGSVKSLPFDGADFDKALAVNSMQVWPDQAAGLREIHRVMKSGARVALGFTPYSGQPNKGIAEALTAAGFKQAHVVQSDKAFSALATKA
jgi:ubiquinone/menaquinone biosynthesis C-methylase UbiE